MPCSDAEAKPLVDDRDLATQVKAEGADGSPKANLVASGKFEAG